MVMVMLASANQKAALAATKAVLKAYHGRPPSYHSKLIMAKVKSLLANKEKQCAQPTPLFIALFLPLSGTTDYIIAATGDSPWKDTDAEGIATALRRGG